MKLFVLACAPLAAAECIITAKDCANFPEFRRTQFRDVVGESYLDAAQDQTMCLMRGQDFHTWCGNSNGISVAATFKPDQTRFYDPSGCDPGWSQWQASCYRFYLDLKTWMEAEEHCRAEGSHLASVHSMEENRFVHLLAHGLKVWIGYHHQNERYSWTDQSQEDFTNFAKNCSGREHEADCSLDKVQQQWHHSSGADRSPYVCKRNAKRASRVQKISVERLVQEEWEQLHLGFQSPTTSLPELSPTQVAWVKAISSGNLEAKNCSGAEFQAKNCSGAEFQAKNCSGAEFQELQNSSGVERLLTVFTEDLSGCTSSLDVLRVHHQDLTAML